MDEEFSAQRLKDAKSLMEFPTLLIIFAIFVVAVLYSSVGHGGASGYLAVMALLAVAPEITRPTALMLNIFVASVALVQFYRTGNFSWRLFLPFVASSAPMTYFAANIVLSTAVYKMVLGAVLICAAARLAWKFSNEAAIKSPPVWLCLIIGAFIGLLSGLVGVGGGIFLTPILLLMNWSETKQASGVSAAFILVNSIAGLAGSYSQITTLPQTVWVWVAAAIAGGIVGSTFGSKKFDSLTLRRVLAAVLLFAGIKLVFV